jgi:hypothetical protein
MVKIEGRESLRQIYRLLKSNFCGAFLTPHRVESLIPHEQSPPGDFSCTLASCRRRARSGRRRPCPAPPLAGAAPPPSPPSNSPASRRTPPPPARPMLTLAPPRVWVAGVPAPAPAPWLLSFCKHASLQRHGFPVRAPARTCRLSPVVMRCAAAASLGRQWPPTGGGSRLGWPSSASTSTTTAWTRIKGKLWFSPVLPFVM